MSSTKHAATVDPNLAEMMATLIRTIRREFRQRLEARDLYLTPLEIHALEYLDHDPGARLQDLVAETGRDKAQVTRLIRSLEDRGLVARERDPRDQRCFRLRLSESGRAVRSATREVRAEIEGRLFATLDAGEQKQLAALVKQCLSSLQDHGGPAEQIVRSQAAGKR